MAFPWERIADAINTSPSIFLSFHHDDFNLISGGITSEPVISVADPIEYEHASLLPISD
jgi:hypothetical protein